MKPLHFEHPFTGVLTRYEDEMEFETYDTCEGLNSYLNHNPTEAIFCDCPEEIGAYHVEGVYVYHEDGDNWHEPRYVDQYITAEYERIEVAA